MNNKRNKIFIVIEYLVLLPGLLLLISYIRTQAQSNLPVAAPIDSSLNSQVKNGILKVGSSTLISFGSGNGGGLISFEGSSLNDWASIGIDPQQKGMSQFWYSVASNPSLHIPFPLWNVSPSSTNSIYTLNQLGFNVNTSTIISSSSMLVFGTNNQMNESAVQTSLFIGGSDSVNGIGIVTNAMTTSTIDHYKGDVFGWNWSDINKDAPVMGLFMTSAGSRGIVMTVANPLNLSPEKENPAIKLNDRWQVPLQVDLNGNAWLGLASTTGAFVFELQYASASSSCPNIYKTGDDQYVKIDLSSTDFVEAAFSRKVNVSDLTSAPLYIFPLSESSVLYKINTTKGCLDQGGSAYYYTYVQYAPLSKANIFVNSVNMVNPSDVSEWNTMATDTLEALVKSITTSSEYKDSATGVRRGDTAGVTRQRLNLKDPNGILFRGLTPDAVDPGKRIEIASHADENGTHYSFLIYDSWALCPNGYFITAMAWSQECTSGGGKCGYVPAIKCGRVVDWRSPNKK